jgi:hypothetical protein
MQAAMAMASRVVLEVRTDANAVRHPIATVPARLEMGRVMDLWQNAGRRTGGGA